MTHTEESLMNLASEYRLAPMRELDAPRQALRLAIREVLEKQQKTALEALSAYGQADENLARAEKAEAERDRLRKQLEASCDDARSDPEATACPVGYKLVKAEAECERLREERDRYSEVLHYIRSELLHSEPNSYYAALWRAIDKALFPKEQP